MHEFISRSESDTERYAQALAAAVPSGCAIGLVGPLGAGKTFFVRSFAAASGIPAEEVTSPTFVLCQEYTNGRKLYHLDAYRLRDSSELLDLGFEEMLADDAIVLVEWADRVAELLPADCLWITIEAPSPLTRIFRAQDSGPITDLLTAALNT